MNNVYEAIKFVNEKGRGDKHHFTACEELALIAIRPFLEVIGGRIALMLDMAIQAERKKQ